MQDGHGEPVEIALPPQVRRQHEVLTQRLLAVMRKVDLCEARVAPALGLRDSSSAQAGVDILQTLDALEQRLAPRAPRGPPAAVLL